MKVDWDEISTRVLKGLAKPACDGCKHTHKGDPCMIPMLSGSIESSVVEKGYCDYYEPGHDVKYINEILIMRKMGMNL